MHEHGHTHEEGMFYHHEARYNLEKIFHNLLLLQDHYSTDPCANCCTKHLSTITAYSEEGRSLDGGSKFTELFDKIEEVATRHRGIVISCAVKNVCVIKTQEQMHAMLSEIRSLRRLIGVAIYGTDTDVASDKNHDFVHIRKHKKATKSEIGKYHDEEERHQASHYHEEHDEPTSYEHE